MKREHIGWREWISLPELGLPKLKAKVDTGARTSCLHAYYITPYEQDGKDMVEFGVHPIQRRDDITVTCHAPLHEERDVTDSGGHKETRYVITTPLHFMNQTWPIEITLTNRDTMLFRFLLGRTAIRSQFLVNPGRSFLAGRRHKEKVYPGETHPNRTSS